MRLLRRSTSAALLVSFAGLILVACGGSESGDSAGRDAGSGSAAGVAGPTELPSVDVLDVADGASVDFAGLIPSDRPLLLWFWAPH